MLLLLWMKLESSLLHYVCRTEMGGPVELPTGTEIFAEAQEKIAPETLEKIKSIL